MIDLAIQIVNYKTKSYLVECLKSIEKDLTDTSLTYSVRILDNASGDDISDIPELFGNLNVSVITSKVNLGFGGGHNLLANGEVSEYLLLVNPDILFIESGSIVRLVKSAKEWNVQVVGPRLIMESKKTQQYDHGELYGMLARIALSVGASYWTERSTEVEASWISGAVFLVQSDVFRDLGGFDTNFFLYKEEEDLCWRVRGGGGKVLYNPKITVLHYGSVVAKKKDYLRESTAYFIEKHFKNPLRYYLCTLLNKVIH